MNAPAKQYATSQDWTRQQAVIMRLYLDEDKTLEEVKSYMEEHHEFFATVSMYKKKFTAWGAFKNLRLDEVLQILHLKKLRDAEQKQSLFFIRNREVDHCSLQVYLSRNPSVFAKLEAGAEPSPEAVRDVSCRTPPPAPASPSLSLKRLSPSPRTPSPSTLSPRTLSPRTPLSRSPSPVVQCNRLSPVPEDMLEALHTYLDRSFDSGLWSWSKNRCWNTRGRNGPSGLLSAVIDRCITAGSSMARQVEPSALRRTLDVPFAMLVRVFKNPPPIMVPKLVSATAHLNRIGRPEIGCLLLQFCRDLAVVFSGPDDPLARFWISLTLIHRFEQQDAMGRILSLCVSEYSTRLGEAHPLTIETYLKYFDTVEREKDPRVQIQSLEHQLSKIGKDFSDGSLLGLLKLEHALATCKLHLEQQRLDKAEEALVRLNSSFLAARDESFRCIWLGYIKCLAGNVPAAESFYKSSVLAAKRTGSRDCVLEALFQLETFFLHFRKPLDAERIRAERFRLLRRDSLIWTDQEGSPHSGSSTSGPSVMILHIGSDNSSARWRPSAFSEITEYLNTSRSVP